MVAAPSRCGLPSPRSKHDRELSLRRAAVRVLSTSPARFGPHRRAVRLAQRAGRHDGEPYDGASNRAGSSVGGCAVIEFSFHDGTYTGTGPGGREWRITRALVGWQLEFRDPGDQAATYAGTHASVFAAQTEAGQ